MKLDAKSIAIVAVGVAGAFALYKFATQKPVMTVPVGVNRISPLGGSRVQNVIRTNSPSPITTVTQAAEGVAGAIKRAPEVVEAVKSLFGG